MNKPIRTISLFPDGEVTDELLAEIGRAAETVLANTVIESFDVVND